MKFKDKIKDISFRHFPNRASEISNIFKEVESNAINEFLNSPKIKNNSYIYNNNNHNNNYNNNKNIGQLNNLNNTNLNITNLNQNQNHNKNSFIDLNNKKEKEKEKENFASLSASANLSNELYSNSMIQRNNNNNTYLNNNNSVNNNYNNKSSIDDGEILISKINTNTIFNDIKFMFNVDPYEIFENNIKNLKQIYEEKIDLLERSMDFYKNSLENFYRKKIQKTKSSFMDNMDLMNDNLPIMNITSEHNDKLIILRELYDHKLKEFEHVN
jgi:hypothetical protein